MNAVEVKGTITPNETYAVELPKQESRWRRLLEIGPPLYAVKYTLEIIVYVVLLWYLVTHW
jgi:hypothetical protein